MRNQDKKYLIIIGIFILPPLSIFLLVSAIDITEYLDELRDLSTIETTRGLIPTYEPEYSYMLNYLRNLTGDDLLQEYYSGLFVGPSNLNCLAGNARFDFGTNRAYEEVIEEYTRKLTSNGWIHSACLQCEAGQNFYDIETARLVVIREETGKGNTSNYPTSYYVSLDFRQPGIPCLRAYW